MSWFEENPQTSLRFLQELSIPKDAAIIDVGGGDSLFVDFALRIGYTDLSVLDISRNAIERAKRRLGEMSERVTWIEEDITSFKSDKKYDFWHDRAVFHFLTEKEDVDSYIRIVTKQLHENGYFVIATFSENGPDSCSGLPIQKYSEERISLLLDLNFRKIRCFEQIHTTPFATLQAFLFCSFQRQAA